jgi:hypothetical protein
MAALLPLVLSALILRRGQGFVSDFALRENLALSEECEPLVSKKQPPVCISAVCRADESLSFLRLSSPHCSNCGKKTPPFG